MTEQKRQNLPAGLWVVATPIGNLEDLTPRARRALELADGIVCEDTRRTATLLSALGIDRPERGLKRFDAHSSGGVIRKFIETLQAGENLALVTDAGTPGISDPGSALVSAAHEAGVRVTPVAGVSAVPALLSVSGFAGTSFVFRGFFPRKDGERKNEVALAKRAEAAAVWVWFESPQRIVESLSKVADEISTEPAEGESDGPPAARLIAAKELTKLHEKIFAGTPRVVANEVAAEIAREGEKGEWAFALELPRGDLAHAAAFDSEKAGESSDWVKALQCLLDARVTASEAARRVSHVFGAPKKSVYEKALKLSGKKA